MERITGRQALSVFAEVEAGKRQLEDWELKYLYRQVNGFIDWLAGENKISRDEAKERAKGIVMSEVKLLLEDDPFADFIWSRGQEVGDTEIDPFSKEENFEENSNLSFAAEQDYWAHMERIADLNVGKYPDEVWSASRDKMEVIVSVLHQIKAEQQNKLLDKKVKVRLYKINKRINELRFGKKPELLNKHWKLCKNLVNELLGNSKRYLIKEPVEKTEEEKIDALDDYGAPVVLDTMNAVYGLDLVQIQEEAQEVFEE
jgi:hypothetical protein